MLDVAPTKTNVHGLPSSIEHLWNEAAVSN
jgi:hypothetical protein